MEFSALVATINLFIKLIRSLFALNSTGTIRKCQKSKILQEMHLKSESVDYSKYIAIVDMGLLWRLSTLSSADREKKWWDSLHMEKLVFGKLLRGKIPHSPG